MSVDMFMKIEGAAGESKDSNHPGWTDIDYYSWSVSQPDSMASGGGAGVGKANFHDLSVLASIDKCYPSALNHCATGKHLGGVELSLCKAGGQQLEFVHITLTDVLVTRVNVKGADVGGIVKAHYFFQAAAVKVEYWEQTNQGGQGSSSQMGFDVKANKVT